MKVYRFMSNREFHALSMGQIMIPENLFHNNMKTTSKGFCFLPESVILHRKGQDSEMPAGQCICFLDGIVSEDVLVEFEAPDGYFRVANGIYADPYCDGLMWINELCCDTYSKDLLVPTRYATIYFHDLTWHPYF